MMISTEIKNWCTQSAQQFVARSRDLKSCAVVTPDGFCVGSNLELQGTERLARFSTVISSLHAVSTAISNEAEIGPQKFIIIDAFAGKLVVCSIQLAEHQFVLAMLGSASALTGSIFVLAKEFALQATTVFENHASVELVGS
jgi:predicted regulator of Ras-like GTPase activity (Roadblock/LC7/MglB family)